MDNESRIYNVRANAGDFIIGEAGRIDINSGQTLEVENYRAKIFQLPSRRERIVIFPGCEVHGRGERG